MTQCALAYIEKYKHVSLEGAQRLRPMAGDYPLSFQREKSDDGGPFGRPGFRRRRKRIRKPAILRGN